MKCKDCLWHRTYDNVTRCVRKMPVKKVNLGDDCRFLDKLPMIKCSNCKFKESEIVPHCTKLNVIVHDNDGCTFGIEKITNGEKFEKIFGISCHEFLTSNKRVDQLEWSIQEYKEPPCED